MQHKTKQFRGHFIGWLCGRILQHGSYQGQGTLRCLSKPILHQRYDALYCLSCSIWLESKCQNKNCRICKERPSVKEALEEELSLRS